MLARFLSVQANQTPYKGNLARSSEYLAREIYWKMIQVFIFLDFALIHISMRVSYVHQVDPPIVFLSQPFDDLALPLAARLYL